MEKVMVEAGYGSSDVFETGKYQVSDITVTTSDTTKPPVNLFIVSPLTKGTYPVLLFCHGFTLRNTWYTDLLQHIASHGYIVVAPQFYGYLPIPIPIPIPEAEEIKRAARVTEWLSTGLPLVLPANVERDIENLALSGHSRGGKIAFSLALGRIDDKGNTAPTPPYKFKAVIGVDPVAGFSPSSLSPPRILEYIPRSFNMSVPVAVIGTGLGNKPKGIIPPFAPNGVNHSEFFNESKPPVAYFLAKDYGHMDMMDDSAVNKLKCICKSGKGPKEDMRRSVGGIVVAFLRSYIGGDNMDMNAIVTDPTIAPITLDPVIYVKE